MSSRYELATRETLIQKLEKLEAVNYGNLYNLCRANYHLKECLEILRENNWRGDLQEQIIEQLEGQG
jgi:hypothetical protein